MKIYQINTSAGQVVWAGTYTKAMEVATELATKNEALGATSMYEITQVVVPLLKPDFLEWLNNNFGGYQNV